MKKLLLIVFLSIASITYAQSDKIKHLDEKNGYGGIKLGDTITNFHFNTIPAIGSSSPDKYGMVSYGVSDKSIMNIGNEIELDNIIVKFYENKVYAIELYFNSVYFSKAVNILQIAYGPEAFRKADDFNYVWVGHKASVGFLFNDNSKQQHITYTDNDLNNKYQVKYHTSLIKAASDL